MKIKLNFGVWSFVICVGKYAEHPLRELIGAGESEYDDFDLEKERIEMWPEDDEK